MRDIGSLIQRAGRAKYISLFDAKSGYWQTGVSDASIPLTAFVCDSGLYEFTRTPFGARNSGSTFTRAICQILKPIRAFTDNYVDDMCVFSFRWKTHLKDLESYLKVIQDSGLTLNLKKSAFGQPEVKLYGQIVGSGTRRVDPDKLRAVNDMPHPCTKKELRRVLGFFSYFREYIDQYARIVKPLTDLTAKRIPNKLPWEDTHQAAFNTLKETLIKTTMQPLQIIDWDKPFHIHVDASEYATAGILTQVDEHGFHRPIAFCSSKLSPTQRAWAVIEKEAFGALSALKRFRGWIGSMVPQKYFCTQTIIHCLSDSECPKINKT